MPSHPQGRWHYFFCSSSILRSQNTGGTSAIKIAFVIWNHMIFCDRKKSYEVMHIIYSTAVFYT